MTLKFPVLLLTAVAVSGCATYVSEKASRVRVEDHSGAMMKKCTNLGPIHARAGGPSMNWLEASARAKSQAREMVADRGGDTLAIMKSEGTGNAYLVHGMALRCD